MASMKKVDKACQRTHRERNQPEFRRRLGELEKKKDYKIRAREHEEKEKTLKTLRQKALDKNPDEFYFHMVNSKVQRGVHIDKSSKPKEDSVEQAKLLKSQDLRYVTLKLQMERKKIEKLRANLHLIEPSNGTRKNTHTFFVDSEEEARKFDPARRLGTHPAMLNRVYNIPRLEDFKSKPISVTNDDVEASSRASASLYNELAKRVQREKELRIVHRKLFVKQQMMASKSSKCLKPKRLKRGNKERAPVYKWASERKR